MSHLLIRLGMCFGFFLGCHLLAPSSGLSQIADVGTVQEAMRVGDYEKAIELSKQQVEKKTWNEAWPRLLATNLMTLGRHPEALDVYKIAQERFSDSLRLK
ncbi:MAG: bacterial transcriptional activator domain-containing protein, partial [Pirellula sp.]